MLPRNIVLWWQGWRFWGTTIAFSQIWTNLRNLCRDCVPSKSTRCKLKMAAYLSNSFSFKQQLLSRELLLWTVSGIKVLNGNNDRDNCTRTLPFLLVFFAVCFSRPITLLLHVAVRSRHSWLYCRFVHIRMKWYWMKQGETRKMKRNNKSNLSSYPNNVKVFRYWHHDISVLSVTTEMSFKASLIRYPLTVTQIAVLISCAVCLPWKQVKRGKER